MRNNANGRRFIGVASVLTSSGPDKMGRRVACVSSEYVRCGSADAGRLRLDQDPELLA